MKEESSKVQKRKRVDKAETQKRSVKEKANVQRMSVKQNIYEVLRTHTVKDFPDILQHSNTSIVPYGAI